VARYVVRPLSAVLPDELEPNRVNPRAVRAIGPQSIKERTDLSRLSKSMSYEGRPICHSHLGLLAGCASTGSTLLRICPAWMGGLPANAPPRPGTPAYDAWQADRAQEAARPKRQYEPADPLICVARNFRWGKRSSGIPAGHSPT
jgi:hypothetical protein